MNVMLDLETMGTEPDSPILSIGAVKYLPHDHTIIDAFHVGVSLESTMRMGFKPTAGTIMWWLDHQRAEARAAWLLLEKVDIATALFGFAQWYLNGKDPEDSVPVLGNGATFDNVLIRTAFKMCGMECPWQFWEDECFRTIKRNARAVLAPTLEEMQKILPGVAHDALFDATRQAMHHQRITDALVRV